MQNKSQYQSNEGKNADREKGMLDSLLLLMKWSGMSSQDVNEAKG